MNNETLTGLLLIAFIVGVSHAMGILEMLVAALFAVIIVSVIVYLAQPGAAMRARKQKMRGNDSD